MGALLESFNPRSNSLPAREGGQEIPVYSTPAEVVFYSDYVVFTEIVARLDFDDFEWFNQRDVLDSVVNVARNIHRLAAAERVFFIANGNFRGATSDYPCFVSVTMPLE